MALYEIAPPNAKLDTLACIDFVIENQNRPRRYKMEITAHFKMVYRTLLLQNQTSLMFPMRILRIGNIKPSSIQSKFQHIEQRLLVQVKMIFPLPTRPRNHSSIPNPEHLDVSMSGLCSQSENIIFVCSRWFHYERHPPPFVLWKKVR